jgi:hypothetical protein
MELLQKCACYIVPWFDVSVVHAAVMQGSHDAASCTFSQLTAMFSGWKLTYYNTMIMVNLLRVTCWLATRAAAGSMVRCFCCCHPRPYVRTLTS